MVDIIKASKRLIYQRTLKNNAPTWALTELAVNKGKKLAKKYRVNRKLVIASLYLAHTIFDEKRKSKIQKTHELLSARFAKKHLDKWKVLAKNQEIILNAIKAHHGKVPTTSLTAEVVKNAECFKFLTLEGCLMFLHDLGRRHMPLDQAVDYVIDKMNQKTNLLTLKDCKREAARNRRKILEIFKELLK